MIDFVRDPSHVEICKSHLTNLVLILIWFWKVELDFVNMISMLVSIYSSRVCHVYCDIRPSFILTRDALKRSGYVRDFTLFREYIDEGKSYLIM